MIYDPYYITLCLSMCYTFRWDRDPISYKMVKENKEDEAFWNHQPATIFSLILALRSIYSSSGRSAGISGGFNTLVWKMCWHLLQTQARPSRLGRCLATWSSNFWHRSAYISVYWCCLLQSIKNHRQQLFQNFGELRVTASGFLCRVWALFGQGPKKLLTKFLEFLRGELVDNGTPLCLWGVFSLKGQQRSSALLPLPHLFHSSPFRARHDVEPSRASKRPSRQQCLLRQLQLGQRDHHRLVSLSLYTTWELCIPRKASQKRWVRLEYRIWSWGLPQARGPPLWAKEGLHPGTMTSSHPCLEPKNQIRTDLPMSMSRVLHHMTHGYIWWVTSFFPPNPSKTIRQNWKAMKTYMTTYV